MANYYVLINKQKKSAKTACDKVCDKLQESAESIRTSASDLSSAASTCDKSSADLAATSQSLNKAATDLDNVANLIKEYHKQMIALLNISAELIN